MTAASHGVIIFIKYPSLPDSLVFDQLEFRESRVWKIVIFGPIN